MTERRSVSIVSPDISANLMIRAFELTRLLSEDFHVQIVGHGRAADLWAPLANRSDFTLKTFEVPTLVHLARAGSRISRELIDGDVLIALGARPVSFGLGLIARRTLGRPLILDDHEWELGFVHESPVRDAFRRPFPGRLLSLRSGPFTHFLDKAVRRAEATLVTTRFLQERHGGYWVPHVRDSGGTPERPREQPAQQRVLHLGTVYPGEGMTSLLRAWLQVDSPQARLRIVGAMSPEYRSHLMSLADDRVSFEDPVPLDEIPSLMAEADIVVIPQSREYFGVLPSKLIEAMAYGRAIVATSVGDIGEWLADGAGIVVPPDCPSEMADALSSLLHRPEEAIRIGRCARERFLRLGSVEAHRPRLVDLVERLILGQPLPVPWPAFGDESLG